VKHSSKARNGFHLVGLITILTGSPVFAQQSHNGPIKTAPPAVAGETAPTKSVGPSYQDTVKWIQDHIADAGFPQVTETDRKYGLVTAYADAAYSIKFNGCDMHLTLAEHEHTTDTTPVHADDQTDSDTSMSATFVLPMGGISIPSAQMVRPQEWTQSVLSKDYVRATLSTVTIVLPDSGIGTVSYSWSTTDESVEPKSNKFSNKAITTGMFPTSVLNVVAGYATRLGIQISYARPGTDDAAQHMAKALSRLHEICKDDPNQAPKDLF
jgi:hypothetical protein